MISISNATPAWYYNLFAVQLLLVYSLIGADIIVSHGVEPPDGGKTEFIVIFVIQAVVQIAIFTVFLTMFAQTFLYQAGLYSILLSRFRTFFAVGFINFGSLLAIRIFRIVHVSHSLNYRLSVWDQPAYLPFYVIQRLVAFLLVVLQTCGHLADESLYRISPGTLQQLITKHGM